MFTKSVFTNRLDIRSHRIVTTIDKSFFRFFFYEYMKIKQI